MGDATQQIARTQPKDSETFTYILTLESIQSQWNIVWPNNIGFLNALKTHFSHGISEGSRTMSVCPKNQLPGTPNLGGIGHRVR